MVQFPEHFRWGAATAAYQIEGAVTEDGRGESIWDRFCKTPGHILNNDTGDVACDSYHLYPADLRLMQDLGLNAYRFSIAWPRILPEGRGQVNAAGLDYYDNLVDTLLSAGITPFATLYHWDLPQALQDEVGGWNSRETAQAFAEYADAVSKRLGDRVLHWITLNEPWVSAFMGNETGVMAPGIQDARIAWQVSHNLLLGHGLAVPVLRANGVPETRVGITLNLSPVKPATETHEDATLAEYADGKLNRWFLDPLFRGGYPADMLDLLATMSNENLVPLIESGDLEIIERPIDFLGVNYYYPTTVHQLPGGQFGQYELVNPEGVQFTEMGWPIVPRGIYDLLTRLHKDYHIPELYITENGAAFADEVSDDGHVHDARRIDYLREHLLQAHAAIVDGVPLAGYFVWSLLDNFEWAHGYSKRFGITYTDYPTQKRVIKDSGYWYRDMIAKNEI
jgi:beta-glucosidase